MNMIKCSCGADIPEATKFCGSCGAKIEPQVIQAVEPPPPVPVEPQVIQAVEPPPPAPVEPQVIQAVEPPPPAPVEPQVIQAVEPPPPAPVEPQVVQAVEPPPPVPPAPAVPVEPQAAQAAPAPDSTLQSQAAAYAATAVSTATQTMVSATHAVASATQGLGDAMTGKKILGFDMKKVVLAAVAAVFVLILAVALFLAIGPSKYQSVKGAVFAFPIDSETSIIFPHKKAGVKVEGEVYGYSMSLDGTKAAITVRDEDSEDGYTLYIVGSKVEKIDRDVRDFWFAPNGGGVVYSKYYDDDEAGELFLWNGGSSKKISNDLALRDGWYSKYPAYDCVISPDGKTVGFVADKGGDDFIGIVWTGGKENELDRRELFVPAAVSNGAKYVYYYRDFDGDRSLFVQRGLNENTRTRLGTGAYIVAFNNDLSQVVLSSGSRSLISSKGRDAVALSGTVNGFIMPEGTREFYLGGGTMYGVSSFVDTYYYNGSIIRIKNGRFDTDSVMRGVDSAFLANDGKTLTYLRNGGIFKVNGKASDPNPVELVRDNVYHFVPTGDGKAVFFIDDHYDINFQKGTGRAVSIAYSFSGRVGMSFALYKGNTLFFVEDGELFSSTGRSSTRISGINMDVEGIYVDALAVYAIGEDGREEIVYRSTNGKKFTEVR
ncbi:MAG: zinc ribbon domain-containing protein [Oscillospiraceae bacterium]|nr:zinc ribbon domain-containing protein [Oscillospiraceae bacterium]